MCVHCKETEQYRKYKQEKNVTQNDYTYRQSLLTFWHISFQR